MQNGTCQEMFESDQNAQKRIDTIHAENESIQTRSERLMNRFKQKMKRFTLESIHFENDTNHKEPESSMQILTYTWIDSLRAREQNAIFLEHMKCNMKGEKINDYVYECLIL